jgi:histidine phosphotransferase ChpT
MTPDLSAPDLSALVSARLCHDLVSPLGAIGNGIELMQMTGAGRSNAEFALISDSLDNALGKLRFLRVAFGPADAAARQSIEEAGAVSAAAFQGRFAVTWITEAADMPRPIAKAIYLALLCLEKSLPLGGTVEVHAGEDSAGLTVEGRRTAAPPELWAHVLEGRPLPPVGSDAVQFVLLRACLKEAGGRIEASFGETGASLRLAVPAVAPA